MLTQDDNVCLIDFNISLAMGGTMESAVGISAGFSPPEQYRDPALYARITHNYTQQRSVRAPEKYDVTEVLKDTDDDKTEILRNEDVDKAEILPEVNEADISRKNVSGYAQYIGRGIDARSDIYSLGVTLYYMLTGVEPSADFEKRVSLDETNVAVSEGFAVILNRMMELAPKDRYQNGGEFLRAVRNCHKLDHRYIVMHRKQAGIQFASLVCMLIGILLAFRGLYKIRLEKNGAYYGFMQQAVETMSQYDYETAKGFLEEAKEIFQTRIVAYAEEVYLLYLSGDYQECISLGENYINTMPFQVEEEDAEQFGNIYYLVGNAYLEIQDYVNAAKVWL